MIAYMETKKGIEQKKRIVSRTKNPANPLQQREFMFDATVTSSTKHQQDNNTNKTHIRYGDIWERVHQQ